MIKTVKLKSSEYFNIDVVEPVPYFLIGGRGTGKSYFVKNHVRDMLLNSNFTKKYLYVRINKNELPTHDSWLQESGITDKLQFDCEDVLIRRGKPFAGASSLIYTTPVGEEQTHIGYVASLETSALIKSGVYSDVGCIVFEEFIRRGLSEKQIHDYCFNFMELIETVMRDREIPIFFIANTLNAFNPLMQAFNKYIVYKIFSEKRRSNIADGKFNNYLKGELYSTNEYNINDFIYLSTVKDKGKPFSIYIDKYYYKDVLITQANSTNKPRIDLLYELRRLFVYSFSTLNFIFDNDKTEIYFYSNIDSLKLKIRNLIESVV
jgi:hypothetical protein